MDNKELQYKYEVLLEENKGLHKKQKILNDKYIKLSNSLEMKIGKHIYNIKKNPIKIIPLVKKMIKDRMNLRKTKVKIDTENILKRIENETIEIQLLQKRDIFQLSNFEGLKLLNIACIMDEFSYICFKEEANFIQLQPSSWKEIFANNKIDFLFIESAWRGKESTWRKKLSLEDEEFLGIIKHCKSNKIPTVFWNKEDPVNFNYFIDIAKLFDFIFTTDLDMVDEYKKIVKHQDVYHLHFAAQPKIHNPIEVVKREDKCCFAGSYYMKYPERQIDFDEIFSSVKQVMPITIYDRNHDKNIASFMFPDKYNEFIIGSLKPEEIDKAYKGYKYNLNMNSVKYSNTMFARRVFELLASNTVVISNYSRGLKYLLGKYVICSDDGDVIKEELNKLFNTQNYYEFRKKGLREVFSKHLYEDRLREVVNKVYKLNLERQEEKILVIILIKEDINLSQIKQKIENQYYKHIQIIILIEDTNQLYRIEEDGLKSINGLEELIVLDYIIVVDDSNLEDEYFLLDLILAYKYIDVYAVRQSNDVQQTYNYVQETPIVGTLFKKEIFVEYTLNRFVKEIQDRSTVKTKTFICN